MSWVCHANTDRVEAVTPWELEVDPDFERAEDKIKRNQESDNTSHPFHNQDRMN